MSERRLLLRALPAGLAVLFVLSALPQPAAANPAVPYCAGSVGPADGVAPGVHDPSICEQATGRVFPEPSTLSTMGSPYALDGASTAPTSDFVSFYEFEAGLKYLAEKYPDVVTVSVVGQSRGNCPQGPNCADSARVTHPIYMVELTNKKSPMPLNQRQSMLFMLSIHGNEKGGREGGMRVLEDLAKGIGFAAETVQDGAGMPAPLAKPTGGEVQTYNDYLDFQRIFLLFPNADGWAHDEVPFIADPYCGAGPGFCRTNGHNVDLNRQAPTAGWQNPNRDPVGEPESIGYYNWMLQQNITWSYAIDIHGMLNHQNFGAIMLPAGAMTPQEMQRSIRLAETLKQRMNDDPHFAGWENAFKAGETAEGAAAPVTDTCIPNDPTGAGMDCPLPGSALANVGSSQFAEYYTVIDAIGYTDSGFNGDYFAQNSGLNAPGYDIELAYNHVTTDSQYEGPGSVFNDYHVHMVREIVKSFMDAAALDVKISFETRGVRTAYVEPSFVATSADDKNPTPGGWADKNPGDDLYDYGTNGGFSARPAQYWEDLKPFVRNGAEPGVLVKLAAGDVNAASLKDIAQLVIPGSAIRDLESNPATIEAIKTWTQAGGNLVLTDEALRFLDLSGVTKGGVDEVNQYMGGIRMDLSKPVFCEYQDCSKPDNHNVRGGVKQTYEPTPLGFETGANAAPNWFVKPDVFKTLGGDQWGIMCGTTVLVDPKCDNNGIGLGMVPLGKGKIQFIGSLLPDPTEEFYHPYGLDPYATTYSGNQILRNMLYWGNSLTSPPIVITDQGIVQSNNEPTAPVSTAPAHDAAAKKSPGLELLPIIGLLGAAAVVLRRRR